MLALGYYQYRVLGDYGAAKTTFERVSQLLRSRSEALMALGIVARNSGQWGEGISYFERALTLDPRNVELLNNLASTYMFLRKFPTALKLFDRVLDITVNDPNAIDIEVRIYQAQGNLKEAARLLSSLNWQAPFWLDVQTLSAQLRYERNYSEAIRFLQAQLA